MFHYQNAIIDSQTGTARIGYYGRVLNTSTGAVIPIFADESSTPIAVTSGFANLAKTDDDGNLSFYVAPGTYHIDIYDTDAETFIRRFSNVVMTSTQGQEGDPGPEGPPGPADAFRVSLAALKGAPISDGKSDFDGSTWFWTLGDYSSTPSEDLDVNIVKSDSVALTAGAWVRQRATGLTSRLPIVGAKLQTQEAVNAITVSVLAFGADPTGVTDSTAAFNLATGAAENHTGNATNLKRLVLVPAGKYRIDGKVYVRRGQQLRGDGWASTWVDFTSSPNGGFVLGCGNSGSVDPGGLGVMVSGIFLYGNASPAIDASKPDSWGVLDCMFTECGVSVRAGGTDGHISRCIFDGGDVQVDLVVGHSHRIIGNLFFNCRTDIRVNPYACDILMSGNIHQYTEVSCLYLVPGAVGIRSLMFVDNLCMMNAQYESHLGFVFIASEGADLQIKGNAFRNGKGFAVIYGGGTGNRFVFDDNDVDGTKTTELYDQSTTAGGVEVSNMEAAVTNNRFLNLKAASIFVGPTAATSLELRGNTFRRCTGGATEVQIVGANANSGIVVDQSNVTDRQLLPAQTGVSVFYPRAAFGRVTLEAGQAVVAQPLTRTSSRVMVQRYQDGGSLGTGYSVSRNPGVGFTITARDGDNIKTAETSIVDWTLDLMGA